MALPLGDFCIARTKSITGGSTSPPMAVTTLGHSSRKASIGSGPRPSLPRTRAASR